jgi:hypothetical protein
MLYKLTLLPPRFPQHTARRYSTPTLPAPLQKSIGNLSDKDKALLGLDLKIAAD